MVSTKVLAVVAVVIAAIGCSAVYFMIDDGTGDRDDPLTPDGPDDPGIPDDPVIPDGQYVPVDKRSPADWTQWLGGGSVPGVSDSRTPVSGSQMTEVWKVVGESDGSMVWKVPGTPICVGDRTYYHDTAGGKVVCVETSSGRVLAAGECGSSSMYNMPLAYGDGKIFVPTSEGSTTVMKVLDADTLRQLFITSPVSGGQVQGPISYHDGKVFFGTYSGEFACFSSEDTDISRGDEVVGPMWTMEGSGWYNSIPAFFGDDCVIVDKGFSKPDRSVVGADDADKPGAVAYLVDSDTGAVRDSLKVDMEFALSGAAAYRDRAYLALTPNNGSYVTEGFEPVDEVRVHSFEVRDGRFVDSSEKIWVSPVKGAGTQAIPVFFNDRMYLGGGGATMGSAQPLAVIDIAGDGTMTTAYTADKVLTKSSVVLSSGYASPGNGNKVYMYVIEYGHVYEGEAADSTSGYADIFCLSDREGQKSAKIEFQLRPTTPQFSFQSFTVSPEGYLLVKNDLCLYCYGPGTGYTADDVASEMDSAVEMAGPGKVQNADLDSLLYRYSCLSDSDRGSVKSSYDAMMDQVATVTYRTGDGDITADVLRNGYVTAPSVADRPGGMFSGWELDGRPFDPCSHKVVDDISVTAVYSPTVTVSFDPAGGSQVASIVSEKGGPMGYVADPARSGWCFDGWYSGGDQFIPQFSEVDSDITLTAHWLKESTLRFDSDGGSDVESRTVVHTKPVGDLEIPFKTGFDFVGWYDGETRFLPDTAYPYEEDLTLKARWTENASRTIDLGVGVKVTGVLPDGVTATIAEKPEVVTSSVKVLREAVGTSGELFMLGLYGGGVDGSQSFTVQFDVSPSFNGRDVDVFYYISNDSGLDPLYKTTGKVESGVLTVDLMGKTSSKGVQIEFALDGAYGIADMISKGA